MDFSTLFQEMITDENTQKYLWAIFLFIITWGGIRLFRVIILSRIQKFTQKTNNTFDDRFVEGIQGISRFFPFILALYISVRSLVETEEMPLLLTEEIAEEESNLANLVETEEMPLLLTGLFLFFLVYEVIRIIRVFVDFALEKSQRKDETMINGIKLSVSLFLWATGVLFVLSNLGFNISALAASLGIGGIAIALAIQNILGDLFASFSLYFDKPFRIGDYIVIGDDKGTVRKIGLKSTRIKTLQGEELVVSNRELTAARVQNFKKMQKRRVSFSLGVEYSTTSTLVKAIPGLIEKAVTAQDRTEFDRCHFAKFGDSALLFDIIYYIDTGDYTVYMDIQQEVNLAIKAAFEKKKIDMAFPTQTVYIRK